MDFISKKVTSTSQTTTGSQCVVTVPTGQVWEIQWSVVELSTSSASGSRELDFVPIIGGINLRNKYQTYGQGPSTLVYYSFAPGLPEDSSPNQDTMTFPFPKLFLGPGDSLIAAPSSMDSSDVLTVYVAYIQHPSA